MEDIANSFKIMLQILTKSFGILSVVDKNTELHISLGQQGIQVWSHQHYNTPHFVLSNAYHFDYLIILACSFLDEYNQHFLPSKSDEFKGRILKFRQQAKPIIKHLGKWKSLKEYRNTIGAHNLRFKDGRHIFEDKKQEIVHSLPQNQDDFILLFELLALITKNIGAEFPELFTLFSLNDTINDEIDYQTPQTDFQTEYDEVCQQIKKLGLTKTERTRL